MDELIAFLTARLDEEEAAALPFGHTVWRDEVPPIGVILVDGEALIEGHVTGLTTHIARHDPARTLREVATWRAILAQVAAGPPADRPGFRAGFNSALGFVLQAKAGEYNDHPDWRMDGRWGRAGALALDSPCREGARGPRF